MACCKGKTGKLYEDNYYFFGNISEDDRNKKFTTITDKAATVAVFDGIGGMPHGEIASRVAAATLKNAIKTSAPANSNELSGILNLINKILCNIMHGSNLKFGTTAELMLINNDSAYFCNIGDSPAFLIRDNEITQISSDHIEQKNVDRVKGSANTKSIKRGLTQYLGIDKEEMILEPHTDTVQIKTGDRLIICTDGLTNMLDLETIKKTVSNSKNADTIVSDLMNAAVDNGGTDDITIICASIRG